MEKEIDLQANKGRAAVNSDCQSPHEPTKKTDHWDFN